MDCTTLLLQASTGSDSGVEQLQVGNIVLQGCSIYLQYLSQVGELRTVLGLYRRHRVSVTSIISGDKSER